MTNIIKTSLFGLVTAAALAFSGCATHDHSGHSHAGKCCAHGKCCTSAKCCDGSKECCKKSDSCCTKGDAACCKKG